MVMVSAVDPGGPGAGAAGAMYLSVCRLRSTASTVPESVSVLPLTVTVVLPLSSPTESVPAATSWRSSVGALARNDACGVLTTMSGTTTGKPGAPTCAAPSRSEGAVTVGASPAAGATNPIRVLWVRGSATTSKLRLPSSTSAPATSFPTRPKVFDTLPSVMVNCWVLEL